MKYILKLTSFALLGLLIISCSKSDSSSKHSASIKLQGVLEKGKATDALCEIKTLDNKLYSKSNHIDSASKGGYVANVPAGAFDVVCKINKYIDDLTGSEVTPKSPITLEAISFAKAGKKKTVNVNVITDLVAKELNRKEVTSESSFNSARETAERVALRDIKAKLKQPINNIDTLYLDSKKDTPLTQVSLAIQRQLDKPNTQATTVAEALKAALNTKVDAEKIVNQHVSDLNKKAIGTELPKDTKPPKPIVTGGGDKNETPTETVTTITLTGATIGGKAVTPSPTGINSQNIAFSLPENDLTQVADSDSVYITSNKEGMTTPIKLEGGKTAPYTSTNVKDLFIPNKVTTFIICVVPTMATPLGGADNGKCQSASVKATFTATAIISSFGDFKASSEILIGGTNVLGDSHEIGRRADIFISIPKTLVTKMPTESVYLTNSKSTTIIQLVLHIDHYTKLNIKSLLLPAGQKKTLYFCILTTKGIHDAESCRKSTTHKIVPVMLETAISGFELLTADVMIGVTHLNPSGDTAIDNTSTIAFSLPKALVTKSLTEVVYVTSNKHPEPTSIKLKLNKAGDKYESTDIKALFNPSATTMLVLCVYSKDSLPSFSQCTQSITAVTNDIKYKSQPQS